MCSTWRIRRPAPDEGCSPRQVQQSVQGKVSAQFNTITNCILVSTGRKRLGALVPYMLGGKAPTTPFSESEIYPYFVTFAAYYGQLLDESKRLPAFLALAKGTSIIQGQVSLNDRAFLLFLCTPHFAATTLGRACGTLASGHRTSF